MAGQRAVGTFRSTPETDPFFYGWRYVTRETPQGPVIEQVPLTEEDILHPQEGDFIVHNAAHDRDVRYLQAVIEDRIADQPDKLLLCDHRVLWDAPDLGAYGSDLILFENVQQPWNPHRGTLSVWDVGAQPVLAIEVTSPSTRNTDLTKKVDHYYRAGIPLYVIVDHAGDEDHPWVRLLAYQAGPDGYVPVPEQPQGIWIAPLRLWLQADPDRVWCADEHGQRIPPLREQRDQERLRAEQAQQLALQERLRAEQEHRHSLEAQQRAEAERQARLALEEKLRQLEQELLRLRSKPSEGA
ncbi:MAG: Uma2 family endonuclease [Gemmataceae bacterium]|nr:Uma2 family endonuclease [Gemmataceae bacterium]